MNDEFWKLKIQAFLHDPPQKALILLRHGEGKHEEQAAILLAILTGSALIPETAKDADHIAAATSRIIIDPDTSRGYKKPEVRFTERPVLLNPLSGEKYDLSRFGPLEKYDIEGNDEILNTAKDAVQEEVKRLKDKYGMDFYRLYLALWRLLPQRLEENVIGGDTCLQHLWRLLPADTRTPDHSIWDHASTTAAIASALPEPAFLLFTVGPVQGFISTARRTQDLWMGSYILSYLTWQAAQAVVKEFGPDSIIFPSLYAQPQVDWWLKEQGIDVVKPDLESLSIANFPNRFLALLPSAQAADMAEAARKSMANAWDEIWQFVKSFIESKNIIADDRWNELWKKQTKDFFESYWLVLPWSGDASSPVTRTQSAEQILKDYEDYVGKPGNFTELYNKFKEVNKNHINAGTCYGLLYDLTERALGARKNIRDFSQKSEEGYKCALCGEREALYSRLDIREGNSVERKIRTFWSQVAREMHVFKLDGSERLCAICTTKRLAVSYFKKKYGQDFAETFPSTSSVAVAPFQERLLNEISGKEGPAIYEALKHFISKIKELGDFLETDLFSARCIPGVWRNRPEIKDEFCEDFLHLDGDWLFEEEYNAQSLKKEYLPDKDKELKLLEEKAGAAKWALKKLIDISKSLDPSTTPARYFAVLHLDGDYMGKWLSGKLGPDIQDTLHPDIIPQVENILGVKYLKMTRPLTPFLHHAISSAQRDYSTKLVRFVVEEQHLGKLIYAGGDDALALVPKNEALEVARELRLLYSGDTIEMDWKSRDKIKSGNGFVYFKESKLFRLMGTKASISAGVALVHHTHALIDAVEQARNMEAEAKKKETKDADKKRNEKNNLGIAAIRRSGEADKVVVPFKRIYNTGHFDGVGALISLKDRFARGLLSPGFITDLGTELNGLEKLPEEAILSRIDYLLHRHIDKNKFNNRIMDEEINKKFSEEIQKISEEFNSFLKYFAEMPSDKEKDYYPIKYLHDILKTASFLAREERL